MNQAKVLRGLTGEQRLEQAFGLSDLVRELAITNIKQELGTNVTKEKIIAKLRERLFPVGK